MFFLRTLTLFLLVSTPSYFALADAIYVEPISSQGVDEASKETVYELITNAVVTEGHNLVTDKSSAKSVLRPKILKLGNAYILKIDKVQNNKIKYSSKMKSAGLDDMDTVSTRVVRSVLREQSAKDSVTVTDVTKDEETQGTRRYKSSKQWRFSFGPAWSEGLNVDGGGTQWGIGYNFGVDPSFDLKLDFSFYVPRADKDDDAAFRNVSLGLDYFLTSAKNSPFISADIGYASAAASEDSNNFLNLSDDKASGWTVGIGLGYKFFRTSTVNLGIAATYRYMFDKTSKSNQTPRLSAINLIVYY